MHEVVQFQHPPPSTQQSQAPILQFITILKANKMSFNIFTGERIPMVGVDPTRPTQAPAAFDPSRPVDGAQSTCPGGNNDRESMRPKELRRLETHEQDSSSHIDEARQNFFSNTVSAEWTGDKGHYHIRALNKAGENSEMGHQWPMAFVGGEAQTINAAMWFKHETDGHILVSVWTFSSTGDETNQYYKLDYQTDAFAVNTVCEELITNEGAQEHFSVSSGDYYANFFYCASLDPLSEEEMNNLQQLTPTADSSGGKKRKL